MHLFCSGSCPFQEVGQLPLARGYDIDNVTAGHEATNTVLFRNFKKQLFHTSLAYIFERLKPYMTTPDLIKCADGLYRKAIYGIGPYIADYPEQVLLAGIVSGWCVW